MSVASGDCVANGRAVTEHFERVLGGPQAHAVAVARKLKLFDLGVFGVGEADVHQADGLAGVGAVRRGRAGDAGDAQAEGGCQCALRMPSARRARLQR